MNPPYLERLSRLLDARKRPFLLAFACAFLALILCWPSIHSGMQTEDLSHRDISRSTAAWVNLWGDGSDPVAQNRFFKDLGLLPWVTPDRFKIYLLRPLSSTMHHIDYRYLADAHELMHLHSLLWFCASVVAAALLYVRVSHSFAVAVLASVFYAVDDRHGMAIGWLANRNALIATALGLFALIAHDRYRREGRRAFGVLAGVLFSAALLSGEIALGAFAFALAYAAFLDAGKVSARVWSLAPWIAVLAIWAAYYRLSAFGSYGSGWYIDPAEEPILFARAVAQRWPLFVTAQLGGLSVESVGKWLTQERGLAVAYYGALLAALLALGRKRRDVRFFACGAALSAVPVCATQPADRTLFFVGIGTSALVASVVVEAFSGKAVFSSRALRFVAVPVAVACVALHGVRAAAALPDRAVGGARFQEFLSRAAATAYSEVRPEQQLVLLNVPDFFVGSQMAVVKSADQPNVPRVRMLYGGMEVLEVHRLDAQTLIVEAAQSFFANAANRAYRGRSHPMRAGDEVVVSGLTIRVLRVDAQGSPVEVAFRFDAPLEDGRYVFRRWIGKGRFHPFIPPAIHETLIVSPFAEQYRKGEESEGSSD